MRVLILPLLFVLAGCPGDDDNPDGSADASCTLDVTVGIGDRMAFAPVTDGTTAELVLGFQGFRMVIVALGVEGSAADTVDLTTFTTIVGTDIELSQTNRFLPIFDGAGGRQVVEDHLIFFNDTPASELIGRQVEVELIVRSGGCVGTQVARLTVVDEEDCVDPDLVVDAGAIDGGVPDGSVVCEDM